MLNLNHKKLEVWKASISLVSLIYKITNDFPKTEIYGITNQLRRAAVSVSSNIAEGAARRSPLERRRFFEIARLSLVEIDTQIEISLKLDYIHLDQNSYFVEMEKMINSIFAVITNLKEKTK